MVDYGHPLRFGSFITPAAAAPQRAVELAVVSEQVGLDLVTFQDHPYQPAFLDTWTLLSWVAARTERIHVSGNVLNVPLRIPSVLAGAAASLDLLSGGRVELGLGAGGFWDAITAMGVPRLTPGEGVDALSEAIDVIRGRWDTADRSVLRAGGEHHRVDGAKRGPAPAHAIPLWIGARGPRMLRLMRWPGRCRKPHTRGQNMLSVSAASTHACAAKAMSLARTLGSGSAGLRAAYCARTLGDAYSSTFDSR